MKKFSGTWRAVSIVAALQLAGCDLFMGADARMARAEERIAARDYPAAVIELRNALKSDPNLPRAHLLLAQVSLQMGDPAAARKELNLASADFVGPPDKALLTARIALELGEFRELLSQIDGGKLKLADVQQAIYRGQALAGLHRLPEAAAAFDSALRLAPRSVEARVGLAAVQAAQGNADAALEFLNQALAIDPDNSEALFRLGNLRGRQGDYARAEAALTAARKNATAQFTLRQQAELLAALTETQLLRGEVSAAVETKAALAKISPEALITRVLTARIDMAKQDYPAAAAELQRVVTAAPEFAMARFLLGAALFAQGNLNQAETQLTQVVQLAPENLEARKLLARIRLRLDRPDAAIQVLLPAEAAAEGDAQTSALLGAARSQLGDEAGALSALEKSAAQHPDNRDLQLNLAAAYLRRGDASKALPIVTELRSVAGDVRRENLLVAAVVATRGSAAGAAQLAQLLAAQPKNVELLNMAGAFHAELGDYDAARAVLAKAQAIRPEDSATLLNGARVEVAAGNAPAAAALLERLVAREPQNMPARLGLAELAASGGDLTGAAKRLQAIRESDPKAVVPRLMLAGLQLQLKQSDAAEKTIAETLAIAPARADLINAAGLLYLQAGRYDSAVQKFSDATRADGSQAQYWLNLARAQLALAQGAAARKSLNAALAQRPDSIAALGALAMLDLREGKRADAVARVAALAQDRPDDAAVAVLDGDLKAALGQFADADAAYGRANRLHPESNTALKIYGVRRAGKLPDPLDALEGWLKGHPDDWTVRLVLGEAYASVGQSRRAIEQYELLAAHRPTAPALNNLAWLYHTVGDMRAEATARRAYDMAPKAGAIADTYGWILVSGNKVKEGIPLLKQAADLAPADPDVGYHYAVALSRSGDKEGARKRLSTLLARPAPFDSQADARRLLEQLSQP